ncbi:hypothetical protein AWJ20_4652 [Sugiyamaella lignohabitans]|uniref:Carboxylesterase type B domain-containing protein n=1 Tax=Sugiyamaella lignohabitans TaxID=796027 RepID=A0A167E6J7_9ASCO|nr:uncharacterized protein AWJ20_4652 [Sugiyamaella lignohabitans]ANB13709.1 hypothetical protein AWJ20_4652 [Sugiyamaella lignohabitans]
MILCQFPRLMALLLPLLALIYGETNTCPAQTCLVSSSGGKFNGICQASFSEFLGIPYAQPPTGNLRFANAVQYTPNSSPRNAKTLPPYCPQTSTTVTSTHEDCLYLNVYTPSTKASNEVLFWIHGGSFIQGGSADPVFNGSQLAQAENIVVVTVNYRLGALGFYDSPETGTNFGLTDVVMALKWVNENIASYGGKPDSVTIAGESSGATVVRTLLMTPSAKGLFSRAIIQSDPQAYSANNSTVSQDGIAPIIDQSLGCSTNSGEDLITCLRNASVSDILSAQMNVYSELTNIPGVNSVYPFGPNVNSENLPMDLTPALTSQSPIVNPVEVMIGVVKDEGLAAVSQVFGSAGMTPDIYQYALAAQLGPVGAGKILSSSLFSTDINSSTYPQGINYELQLSSIATEYEFSCPSQMTAQLYQTSSHKYTYFYQFVEGIQYPDNSGFALCSNGAVCHEDDLYLVFGTYPNPTSLSSSQTSLVKEVQTRWGSFVKNGNPNCNGYSNWTPSSGQNLNVQLLGGQGSISSIDQAQCQFLDTQLGYYW